MYKKNDGNTFKLTIVKKKSGTITKSIYLDDEGKTQKDLKDCYLDCGFGQVVEVTLKEFPQILRSLDKNECIIHGIFDDSIYGNDQKFVNIVTKKAKNTQFGLDQTYISRTKGDYFNYPENNALVMLDFDNDGSDKSMNIEKYISIFSKIFPEFQNCAKVYAPSTSSYLYDLNGKLISDPNPSFHLYFLVKDSSDINRFVDVLFKKCWLNGYGRIVTNKNKVPMVRTIFDKMVFSPERLDFVSGANCSSEIIQRLPLPIYYDGDVLDTSLLKDLITDKEIQYQKLSHQYLKPYQDQYENYKTTRCKRYVKEKNFTEKQAVLFLNDEDNRVLWNDYTLNLDDGSKITVSDLLADGQKYDGITLHDPCEPEKGRGKAKFFWNDGVNPLIHSFLNGESNYNFKKFAYHGGKTKLTPTDSTPTFGKLDSHVSLEEARERLKHPIQSFLGLNPKNTLLIMNAGIGKSRGFLEVFSDSLARTEKLHEIKVAYFVPDNQLSLELYEESKKPPLIPAIIRGKGHYTDTLAPPCKIAKSYRKSGTISDDDYNLRVKLITANVCEICPHRKINCEYFKQFKRAKIANIVFFPHQYLFAPAANLLSLESNEDFIALYNEQKSEEENSILNSDISSPYIFYSKSRGLIFDFTHVVIDEDIVNSHILDNKENVGVFKCDRTKSDLVKEIITDFENGVDLKYILLSRKDDIKKEAKKHRKLNSPSAVSTLSELNSSKKLQEYNDFQNSYHKKQFWLILYRSCLILKNSNNTSTYINDVWVDGNELKVGRKQKINSLWLKKHILYFDASAVPEIVKQATGIDFNVIEIKARFNDNVHIKQCYDQLFTSKTLLSNIDDYMNTLFRAFPDKIEGLIVLKKIEDIYSQDLDSKNVIHGHFGKIRGTDKFKKLSSLAILGRYMINPDALKEKLRLLYPVTSEPLDFEYSEQEFIYRLKDNKNFSTFQKDYKIGSYAWKLNNHISKGETIQAISRIRPYDIEPNTPSKTVYIFTSQVLDLTVDELFSFSELQNTKPITAGRSVQDGIIGLLHLNNDILKWEPSKISDSLGISIDTLNRSQYTKWFQKNDDWECLTVHYDKVDQKSRKRKVKNKLIVSRTRSSDQDYIIKTCYSDNSISNISITNGW